MRELLSAEYVPFGTQYYRAPSPRREEWERDLKNIAALGLNTVKFWVQWRWNQPKENTFAFDDIDELMDLAQKYDLRVMLNTIVDVAPAWIYRKYPDASMQTLDGRSIGPQTQPHRQIGGLGYCFNHPAVTEQMLRFLRTAIQRYSDHSALEMWNVASEPELTSSMAELRLYAQDATRIGDMLCYCPNCVRTFKQWLKAKYTSIEVLNVSWNRNYSRFEEVEVPRTRNTFNDMIDWRMFFVDTIGNNVRRRFEVAAKADRRRHPLLCHHVFIQGFPVTSTANDPWNVGRFGDLHGFTQMDDPMMADVLRSCAKGKPVISAEMLMLFGYTLDLPRRISADDIKRFVFTGVAANLKGFLFWQYRPETLGREAPAWGLSSLDGSPTPWLKSFSEVNAVVQKNAAFVLDALPRKAQIALLYSPENQIFAWEATGNEKTATDSLLGVHKALYERNEIVDFLHPKEIDRGSLSEYRVLYIPFPYYLSKSNCSVLESWVKGGGILIGEAYCAGWNAEQGCHHTSIPGYNLDAVFGANQSMVEPASSDGLVEIITPKGLGKSNPGTKLYGAVVKETLRVNGAEIIATFTSGEAAITRNNYGKGTAFLIGTYFGLPVQRNGAESNADFISAVIDSAFPHSKPVVSTKNKIRVDILAGPDKGVMLIVRNLEQRKIRAALMLPSVTDGTYVEQFGKEDAKVKSCQVTVTLQPGEVRVYRG